MIAVTGETRASVVPDVPTFKEAGYPNLTVEIAYFLLAPKARPSRSSTSSTAPSTRRCTTKPKIKEALFAQGRG